MASSSNNDQALPHQLARDGLSQDRRAPAALEASSAPIDARTTEDLLRWTREFAEKVHHFESSSEATSTWKSFFELPAGVNDLDRLTHQAGRLPPHLGLLIAFLELCKHPVAIINQLTDDHLRLQFERVLGFSRRPNRPDRAHLVAELKRGVSPLLIGPGERFVGGKDVEGVELIYRPVRDAYVGNAAVANICSISREADASNVRTGLRFAPFAMSADGLGAALPADDPSWPAFGQGDHPVARPGFAVASPTLRLASGDRTITLRCQIEVDESGVGATPVTESVLAGSFDAYLTSPKGWIGPMSPSVTLAGSELSFVISLGSSEPAVSDYSEALHGQHYETTSPMLHLQLRSEANARYETLTRIRVKSLAIDVKAVGIRELTLENDESMLNPKKAFMPFGAQPSAGATFVVGCAEAFAKSITDLTVHLAWKTPTDSFATLYSAYPSRARIAGGVPVTMTFIDRDGPRQPGTAVIEPSQANGVTDLKPLTQRDVSTSTFVARLPSSMLAMSRMAALHAGGAMARRESLRIARSNPIRRAFARTALAPRPGALSIRLDADFLHQEFRTTSIQRALDAAAARTVAEPLSEPYTPIISTISLDYDATSGVTNLSEHTAESFADAETSFYHVDCFGHRREHPYLRDLARRAISGAAPSAEPVTLLPRHDAAAECLIGMTGVGPGEAVHMLVKTLDGSAEPSREPQELTWSVLCDNDWMRLGPDHLTLDESHDFRTTGIVAFTVPQQATLEHTLMPSGLLWIRASIAATPDAACRLIAVHPNAIEVVLEDPREDPSHLAAPLPAGRISKARPGIAGLKSILQPYPSFGGLRRETERAMRIRASERLRHRGRAVQPSDYEHLVLDRFPEVHHAKCIPHVRPSGGEGNATSWQAAGHVTMVVIPNVRGQRSSDPLRPRCDLDTLERVQSFLSERCGMGVTVHVKNPTYQRLQVRATVALRPGRPFNLHRAEIEASIVRALTPWAFDTAHEIRFGGEVYRSAMLGLIESNPSVDFIESLEMSLFPNEDSEHSSADAPFFRAQAPDAILISHARHVIQPSSNA
jgi:hypothetical protein